MTIIEKVDNPQDFRIIDKKFLPKLAEEIRWEIIHTTSHSGGHLAGSLGVVDLTIALHYVFDTPQDKIIWDVGHQAYAHKIITGRRNEFCKLRQMGGISGFPRRNESVHDAFGVGHSSTSISSACGFAVARDLKGEDYRVVAVIGDGGMTGGEAFEGLNNAGHLGVDVLVILNDNEMYISHRVGAIAGYLTKLMTLGLVKKLERKVEKFLKRISFWGTVLLRLARRFKVLLFPGMLFEEMGFAYLGPINGHDIYRLIEILSKVKDMKGPTLVHVITRKGKGYEPAESNPTRFHSTGPFNIITGVQESKSSIPTYTQVFSKTLISLARDNDKIVGITAAMPEGTGLDSFKKEFPKRYFDVGIAEQHAVTFAAGLACEGFRPVCAIYSTFLQRAFDQIVHDVCLQNLPVIFAVDRAGIVGEDGATHHGVFDLSYLRIIPNMVIMAPKDENELQHMLYTAISTSQPVAIRYPRGTAIGVKLDKEFKLLTLGKGEVIREGRDMAIFAIGNMVNPSLLAAERLSAEGFNITVLNLRYAKPLDEDLIRRTLNSIKRRRGTKRILTVEENSLKGGVGSGVREIVENGRICVKSLGLPDYFIEHGSPDLLREKHNLTADSIALKIRELMKMK